MKDLTICNQNRPVYKLIRELEDIDLTLYGVMLDLRKIFLSTLNIKHSDFTAQDYDEIIKIKEYSITYNEAIERTLRELARVIPFFDTKNI
jgi:hypothetical protein